MPISNVVAVSYSRHLRGADAVLPPVNDEGVQGGLLTKNPD